MHLTFAFTVHLTMCTYQKREHEPRKISSDSQRVNFKMKTTHSS
jgi:hypothetical protein